MNFQFSAKLWVFTVSIVISLFDLDASDKEIQAGVVIKVSWQGGNNGNP